MGGSQTHRGLSLFHGPNKPSSSPSPPKLAHDPTQPFWPGSFFFRRLGATEPDPLFVLWLSGIQKLCQKFFLPSFFCDFSSADQPSVLLCFCFELPPPLCTLPISCPALVACEFPPGLQFRALPSSSTRKKYSFSLRKSSRWGVPPTPPPRFEGGGGFGHPPPSLRSCKPCSQPPLALPGGGGAGFPTPRL